MTVWDSDGATADPIGDLRWTLERKDRICPAPIVVNGIAGMRDFVRLMAAAFPCTQSFVSIAARLNPPEFRRAVLRSEIYRRRAM